MESPFPRRGERPLIYHYLMYPLIILVVVATATIISGRVVREAVYDTHRQDLETVARMINNIIPPEALSSPEEASVFARKIAEDTGTRITIIAPDGHVLGDSHAVTADLDNHATRPEVRTALEGNDGVSIRFSRTLGEDLIYAALPVLTGPDKTVIGVVRSSLIVNDIQSRLTTLRRRLILPGLAVLVIALVFGILLSRRIRYPLRELHRISLAYAEGELDRTVKLDGPRELKELGRSMEVMARELSRQIRSLEDQRLETEEVLNTIREPLLLLDRETRIQRINEAGVQFLATITPGPDRSGIIGRMLLDIFRNSEIDSFLRLVRSSNGMEETRIVTYGLREQRLHVWGVHMTARTSMLQGHTLLLIRDITPEFRMQQVRKDFVANVSHELKTPLTLIQGAVETLREIPPELPEERDRFEAMIENHTRRMSTVVEDLLNLARIEQEEEQIITVPVEICPALREALEQEVERGRRNGISVTLECPHELVWSIHRSLFLLAVRNLVDNALRYSSGGSAISVSARQEAGQMMLTVTDEGCGIPESDISRIFERFYRVDPSRSRAMGGTGLGLSIVKHVTRIHNGTVDVTSAVGKGSTFTITLPEAQP